VALEVAALRKALRAYLIATYGAKSAIVASFGFTPKARTVAVATKAASIEKRAATRAAREPKGEEGPVVPATNGVAPKAVVAN
jgi:hypothetical protein